MNATNAFSKVPSMCQTLHWVLRSEMNKAKSLRVCFNICLSGYTGTWVWHAGSLVETYELFFSYGLWDLVP